MELAPDDLLNESGSWNRNGTLSGKSASNLRRVHVLTDPVHRPTEEPGDTSASRAPAGQDIPQATPTIRSPSRGEMIIGGTREELEAASQATTLRLDPASAAAAVHAATTAAASASSRALADTTAEASAAAPIVTDVPAATDLTDLPRRSPDPSSNTSIEFATDSGTHRPEASLNDSAALCLDHGAPASGSGRPRSSAMSGANHDEPRDWGTIPPLATNRELVPTTATTPAPLGRTLPEVAGDRKFPLLPVLVVIALALLAMLYAF